MTSHLRQALLTNLWPSLQCGAGINRYPDPPTVPLGHTPPYVLASQGPGLGFAPAKLLRASVSSESYELEFEVRGHRRCTRARFDEVVRLTADEFDRISRLQADSHSPSLPFGRGVADAGVDIPPGRERVFLLLSELVTRSTAGAQALSQLAALPDTRMIFDTKIEVSREDAEIYYDAEVIGAERDKLVRLLWSRPCHTAVIEGPNIITSWLEIVEDTKLSHVLEGTVVHSSLSPAHTICDIRHFFGRAQKALAAELTFRKMDHAVRPTVLPEEQCSVGNDLNDEIPLQYSAAMVLAQGHQDGLFYPVCVKDHLGDGLFVTGGGAWLTMLSGEPRMINCTELDVLGRDAAVPSGTWVLARFPSIDNSECVYGPAKIDEGQAAAPEDLNRQVKVTFYNGVSAKLAPEDCLVLDPTKFRYDNLVSNVVEVLQSKIGEWCLARRDDTGYYALAVVTDYSLEHTSPGDCLISEEMGTWRAGRFAVRFETGEIKIQYPRFVLFFEDRMPANLITDFDTGDYIVARYNSEPLSSDYTYPIFGPAVIEGLSLSGDNFRAQVRFWNTTTDTLGLADMIMIPPSTYFEIMAYFDVVNRRSAPSVRSAAPKTEMVDDPNLTDMGKILMSAAPINRLDWSTHSPNLSSVQYPRPRRLVTVNTLADVAIKEQLSRALDDAVVPDVMTALQELRQKRGWLRTLDRAGDGDSTKVANVAQRIATLEKVEVLAASSELLRPATRSARHTTSPSNNSHMSGILRLQDDTSTSALDHQSADGNSTELVQPLIGVTVGGFSGSLDGWSPYQTMEWDPLMDPHPRYVLPDEVIEQRVSGKIEDNAHQAHGANVSADFETKLQTMKQKYAKRVQRALEANDEVSLTQLQQSQRVEELRLRLENTTQKSIQPVGTEDIILPTSVAQAAVGSLDAEHVHKMEALRIRLKRVEHAKARLSNAKALAETERGAIYLAKQIQDKQIQALQLEVERTEREVTKLTEVTKFKQEGIESRQIRIDTAERSSAEIKPSELTPTAVEDTGPAETEASKEQKSTDTHGDAGAMVDGIKQLLNKVMRDAKVDSVDGVKRELHKSKKDLSKLAESGKKHSGQAQAIEARMNQLDQVLQLQARVDTFVVNTPPTISAATEKAAIVLQRIIDYGGRSLYGVKVNSARAVYDAIETYNDRHKLSWKEGLFQGLSRLNILVPEEQQKRFFDDLDVDRDGELSFEEFDRFLVSADAHEATTLLLEQIIREGEHEVTSDQVDLAQQLFRSIDKDHNEKVTFNELYRAFTGLDLQGVKLEVRVRVCGTATNLLFCLMSIALGWFPSVRISVCLPWAWYPCHLICI